MTGNKSTAQVTEAAREKLRQFVNRIEAVQEEKDEATAAMKEIYGEAKAFGYDVKALKQLIKIRQQDRAAREEQEAILDVYMLALGEI